MKYNRNMSSLRQTLKRKGSIVITVLILMVVSSFLVLLTMRYVLSMLSGFVSLTNYYKAYYLARGWMDVLLTQHSYRWWWYETDMSSSGTSFQCGWSCGVQWSIRSRFPRIDSSKDPIDTTCSAANALSLQPWQSAIYALFSDEYLLPWYFVPLQPLIDYQNFPTIKNIDMYVYDNPTVGTLYRYDSRDWVFGKTYPFEYVNTFWAVPGTPWDKRKSNILAVVPNYAWIFLIVNNPSLNDNPAAKPFRYCFSTPQKNMIWQTNIIRSRAFVQNADVTLETIKTNRFPSILVQ